MKILLFKTTKDSDLRKGLQVCYKNLQGAFTQLGTITDIIEQDGVKLYLLNTAMGAYMADELKLVQTVEQTAKKMKRLTNCNNHTLSVIAMASFIDDKEATERLEEIEAEVMRIGYITQDLLAERREISTSLLNKVCLVHGEKAKKMLYQSM